MTKQRTTLLTLPQEIRDTIYTFLPMNAWVMINQTLIEAQQPPITRVNRQLRAETLATYYTSNNFVLDLGPRKGNSYPQHWKATDIFLAWLTAIGEENAARLRCLMIYAPKFRIVLRIDRALPISITHTVSIDTKSTYYVHYNDVPSGYDLVSAAQRVKRAFSSLVQDIEHRAHKEERSLSIADFVRLQYAVVKLRAVLCTHVMLGFGGAILAADCFPEYKWPNMHEHLTMCAACGL